MSDYIPPEKARKEISRYISSELISNILINLPVDDLLRCTSVCKSWYDLITSSSFISSHLEHLNSNQSNRLLFKYVRSNRNFTKTTVFTLHIDDQSFEKIAQLDSPKFPLISRSAFKIGRKEYCSEFLTRKKCGDINIIGSFNGVYCLSDFPLNTTFLWNPTLRKSVLLPKPIVSFESKYSHCIPGCIGFGFLPKINEYKIIRFMYHSYNSRPSVEIFDLNVGSWRDIKSDGCVYRTKEDTPQAFLNGVLHWPAHLHYYHNSNDYRMVGLFDIENEKFGSLMLPRCLHDARSPFNLFINMESLCLTSCDESNVFHSIWVMKEYGVEDSWERLFNIDIGRYDPSRPIYCRENGEILFFKKDGNSYDDYNLISCNMLNEEVKNLGLKKVVHMVSYVESLVFVKVSNKLSLEKNQSNTSGKRKLKSRS